MVTDHILELKTSISKYLDEKYKNVSPINYDSNYLDIFDKEIENTDDILKVMFILPNGKLKRFKIDLSDFYIDDIYKLNNNIYNDNIYNFLNLDHNEIKYIGFDLNNILKAGCIRVSNNLKEKELDIGMDLRYNKPNTKMLKIIDNMLPYYETILVDFIANRKGKSYTIDKDTIKTLTRDINSTYNIIHS